MKHSVRALAFIAAILAHIVLVALLMAPVRRDADKPVDDTRMVVVSIEPEAPPTPSEPFRSVAPALPLPAPAVTVEPPRLDSSGPITLPPESPPESAPALPSIDWQQEARSAAARLAESLDTERRRNGKFAPDPRFARPTPRPQFGWDRSKTHRIEALPEGGTLIHLNDRCVIALTGLFFPMCKLGKISARGDLFEHMGDAPASDE